MSAFLVRCLYIDTIHTAIYPFVARLLIGKAGDLEVMAVRVSMITLPSFHFHRGYAMRIQTSRFALRGFVALLLLSFLLLAAGVAGATPEMQTSIDVFCVTGSVIDHAEKPSGDWTITAVMYDPPTGLLDPGTAVDA